MAGEIEHLEHLAHEIRGLRTVADKTLVLVQLHTTALSGFSDRQSKLEGEQARLANDVAHDDRRISALEGSRLSWLRVALVSLVLVAGGGGIALAAQAVLR